MAHYTLVIGTRNWSSRSNGQEKWEPAKAGERFSVRPCDQQRRAA